jgi:Mismatch repair ATPase (MutS family)
LLWAIDRTLTAMGGRCLRRWLEAPLMDRRQIEQRQALVSTLVEQRSCGKVCAVAAIHGRPGTTGGSRRCRPCRSP